MGLRPSVNFLLVSYTDAGQEMTCLSPLVFHISYLLPPQDTPASPLPYNCLARGNLRSSFMDTFMNVPRKVRVYKSTTLDQR